MSSILANQGMTALLAETEGVWKRIFGLDAQVLFDTCITLISMLILFALLSYLLFNPARALINKRKELVAGDMEAARKSKEEAEAFKKEYDARLKDVGAEANEILSQTKKKAKKQEDNIVNEAKEEAGRIIKRAESEAKQAKLKAQDEMKQEIIAVATLMAGKMVRASIDEEGQNELVETTLKEMGEDTWQN